jgi:MEMO1 family protein
MSAEPVRKPAVAGQFYPSDPASLRGEIIRFLDDSGVEPSPGRVHALVSPHAGYMYSGPAAGCAFARVRGRRFGRVVLLGCSHREQIRTASVYTGPAFATPLGLAKVDAAFAARLARSWEADSGHAHGFEHALEVQVPFIQVALGDTPIVPVLFGSPPGESHGAYGEQLAQMLDPEDLVLASTDLSHYLDETRAEARDAATLRMIEGGDWRVLARGAVSGEASLCGSSAVTVAMACAAAQGANTVRMLDYRTSARASGDTSRVVGYAALSMESGL